MTILMGDFNAKIGSDNTGYEDIMGTHGLGQMNENGERFADLCALNQLVIRGSIRGKISKPHGDPQTTEQRTRSTIFASAGSSGGHGGT